MTLRPADDPAPALALSGRPLHEITVEAASAGELTQADLRIHPETLRHQASVAEQGGNPELARNLRRAAELTALGDAEVLAVYEALRPGRSTLEELEAVAARLEEAGAPACAGLVREAATVYARRGLCRSG